MSWWIILLLILMWPLIDVSTLVRFAEAQDRPQYQSRTWLMVRMLGWALMVVVIIVFVVARSLLLETPRVP